MAKQKSAISFGLVHIPISLHNAISETDVHFNQLHKEDNSRIRYKKTCAHCGKEVGAADIVKGFEYDSDQYVIVSSEDFEKIKTEKDRAMHILHFTSLDTISPVYFEKTYHAVPEPGGEKAFELLRKAMMNEQRIAVAKTVLGTKETLIEAEVKALPTTYTRPEVSEPELAMAQQLIAGMEQPFSPQEYHDEYQGRLRELIAQKIAGKEVVAAAAAEEAPQGKVIDLMEALQKSIEQAGA